MESQAHCPQGRAVGKPPVSPAEARPPRLLCVCLCVSVRGQESQAGCKSGVRGRRCRLRAGGRPPPTGAREPRGPGSQARLASSDRPACWLTFSDRSGVGGCCFGSCPPREGDSGSWVGEQSAAPGTGPAPSAHSLTWFCQRLFEGEKKAPYKVTNAVCQVEDRLPPCLQASPSC